MKRFLIILLTVSLLFTAGCSNNSPFSGTSGNLSSTPENTVAEKTNSNLTTPLFLGVKDDTYYYINSAGDVLNASSTPIGYYSENGLAPVKSSNGYLGYVDKDNVYVIDPQFEDAGAFGANGLAPVAFEVSDGISKMGFVNSQGDIVIDCQYDFASCFYPNGYAIVGCEDEGGRLFLGVIDSSGSICIPIKYSNVSISKDYVLVTNRGGIGTFPTFDAILDYNGNIIQSISLAEHYEYFFCTYEAIYKLAFAKSLSTWETQYLFSNGTFEQVMHIEKQRNPWLTTQLNVYDYSCERKLVVGTPCGSALNLMHHSETLAGYKYDECLLSNDLQYLLMLKWQDSTGETYLADIYDLTSGTQTGNDIAYIIENEFFLTQHMPTGYFLIRTDSDYPLYGIIDHTGTVIMEPVYESIKPYNFFAFASPK